MWHLLKKIGSIDWQAIRSRGRRRCGLSIHVKVTKLLNLLSWITGYAFSLWRDNSVFNIPGSPSTSVSMRTSKPPMRTNVPRMDIPDGNDSLSRPFRSPWVPMLFEWRKEIKKEYLEGEPAPFPGSLSSSSWRRRESDSESWAGANSPGQLRSAGPQAGELLCKMEPDSKVVASMWAPSTSPSWNWMVSVLTLWSHTPMANKIN